jgi:hypothetical protein
MTPVHANGIDSQAGAQQQTPSFWLRNKLAVEIALLLAVKLVLLFLLWELFFAAPQAKHMRMPEPQVTERLVGAQPAQNK